MINDFEDKIKNLEEKLEQEKRNNYMLLRQYQGNIVTYGMEI
jgi:hypothetical protein